LAEVAESLQGQGVRVLTNWEKHCRWCLRAYLRPRHPGSCFPKSPAP
jgi:hypothetical protein